MNISCLLRKPRLWASELADTTGIMDYGSLIYVTYNALAAREAIKVMTDLVQNGYYKGGELYNS